MILLKSGEDYLECIYKLSLNKNSVHAIDIANELNFSKPSVSVALKKLKNQGYLIINNENHIILTKAGLLIAKEIYERHQTLTTLLIKLGIDEKKACEEACKIEHDISPATFEALRNLLKKL